MTQRELMKLADQMPFEAKSALGIEMSWGEKFYRKTAAEDQKPGRYFWPFGIQEEVPEWLDHDYLLTCLPEGAPIRLVIEGGQNQNHAVLIKRPRYTLNAATYCDEALKFSAMYARWYEFGIPPRTRTGDYNLPPLNSAGAPIVNVVDHDDGSQTVTIAVGLARRLADFSDLAAFNSALGMGHQHAFTPWKGGVKGFMLGGSVHLPSYPVGMPQMVEKHYPPQQGARPRPTTHGSAQWATGLRGR